MARLYFFIRCYRAPLEVPSIANVLSLRAETQEQALEEMQHLAVVREKELATEIDNIRWGDERLSCYFCKGSKGIERWDLVSDDGGQALIDCRIEKQHLFWMLLDTLPLLQMLEHEGRIEDYHLNGFWDAFSTFTEDWYLVHIPSDPEVWAISTVKTKRREDNILFKHQDKFEVIRWALKKRIYDD